MITLIQDLRYAWRTLLKTPGFTAVAVLTLALGIGANTAVFSVLDAVVLRPLPYPQPDKLVSVQCRNPRTGLSQNLSYPDFFDFRGQNHVFEHLVTYRDDHFTADRLRAAEAIERRVGHLGPVWAPGHSACTRTRISAQ